MTGKAPAVAYVNANLLITESEVTRVRESMARFADEWGYDLDRVHVEDRTSGRSAFNAMVTQLTAEDITTVLVPSLHHFAGIGHPVEVKNHLQLLTAGRVIPTGTT
ncbi:recombinase family protein [Kribbella solani]|uniref:Recombinase family protein n=1 Tax=Kribbella solani TaxID=236067 RepID=A0A841E0C8_9ACTN|nr:recombinase family protein [Kribbella solani]MBB5982450.1 hypothetical protein [Kribbella solani]